ncbi:MAG: M23 family metallopeptidase [Rhodobacter sp.]|nr:M23 family metallopeptidase [Rhodobacter sp.]
MAVLPVAIMLVLGASMAAADAPKLSFPVDCALGETCYIQNYVDRDPSPGYADFGCGALSYDGHKGTDIALRSRAAMAAGVAVYAAAAGTVRGTRDGMADKVYTADDAEALEGRDCGNGLVIDHGQGWQTQYCHLRRGSLAVQSGDAVAAGDLIGQVGLSGRTQFPHLHISVRKDGEPVDPFQPDGRTACSDTGAALWADDIAYSPGGMIDAGFSPALPDYDAIKAGTAASAGLRREAEALVMWVYLYGGREGDRIVFDVDGPDGPFLDQTTELTRTQAQLFRAVGRKRRAQDWTDGIYTGTATLIRGTVEIDRISTQVVVAR